MTWEFIHENWLEKGRQVIGWTICIFHSLSCASLGTCQPLYKLSHLISEPISPVSNANFKNLICSQTTSLPCLHFNVFLSHAETRKPVLPKTLKDMHMQISFCTDSSQDSINMLKFSHKITYERLFRSSHWCFQTNRCSMVPSHQNTPVDSSSSC